MKIIAKVLLLDSNNKVLILYRSNTHPNFPNEIDLPGGEVNDNESPIQAIKREALEETGLQIPVEKINLIYEKQSPNSKQLVFNAPLDMAEPEIKLSWEHSRYEWIDISVLMNFIKSKTSDDYFESVRKAFKSSNFYK